jgi:hypothetical protein
MGEVITLRSMLIGALLVVFGTIMTAYAEYAFYTLLAVMGLLILTFIPGVLCTRCGGRGSDACRCVDGYLSPRIHGTGWGPTQLHEQGSGNSVMRIPGFVYQNNGGRGSAILKVTLKDALGGEVRGEYVSDEIRMEASYGSSSMPLSLPLIEVPINNFSAIKKRLDREPNAGDFSIHTDWTLVDKGEPCTRCNHSGRRPCPACDGKRLRF